MGAFAATLPSFAVRSHVLARRSLDGDFPCEGHGTRQQLALNDFVEDAGRECVGGFDRFAARAHLGGFRHAGQPRQPLRAAGTGNQSDLDLRLADLRVRARHAVMARHRHFQSAAEPGAVDGDHDRFRAVFQCGEQRVEPDIERLQARREFAELLDIRPAAEGPTAADQDDGLDGRVLPE